MLEAPVVSWKNRSIKAAAASAVATVAALVVSISCMCKAKPTSLHFATAGFAACRFRRLVND